MGRSPPLHGPPVAPFHPQGKPIFQKTILSAGPVQPHPKPFSKLGRDLWAPGQLPWSHWGSSSLFCSLQIQSPNKGPVILPDAVRSPSWVPQGPKDKVRVPRASGDFGFSLNHSPLGPLP